ncbi:MAG: phytanoyl-CoA dioxygenase family protein [Gammaproteobacteria bacterium]|nr:phytanoyl-CoA dioxygenase family protein [Gammaproteobacteria bacterium]
MGISLGITTPVLDPAQMATFRATGYLVVRRVLPQTVTASLARWADEVAALPEMPGRQAVYRAPSLKHHGRCLVQRIERVTPFHDGFHRLTLALALPAGQLLGDAALLLAERLEFLQPGREGCVPHRDAAEPWMRYATGFVSVIVAIDPTGPDQACLEIAPGQHRHGLHRPAPVLDGATIAALDFDPVPVEPGDLVYVHPYAPHRVRRNRSGTVRRRYRMLFNRLADGDHQAQFYAERQRMKLPDIDRLLADGS